MLIAFMTYCKLPQMFVVKILVFSPGLKFRERWLDFCLKLEHPSIMERWSVKVKVSRYIPSRHSGEVDV